MYYDCTNQGVLTKLWETRAILYYRVGQMSRANGQTATLCNRYSLPPLYTFYLHECTYDTYDRPIHQIYGNYYSVNYAYDSVRSWLTSKTTYNDSQSLQELQYSYDAVGNIIAIQQNADSVHWLGGQYMQEFQYDAQNRLRRADMISDYWGLYSNYNLTYSPSGMIGIKSCDDMLWNYWHGYCSANDKIINHQVRSIYDMENDATTFYQWDAAGRLQNIYIPCAGDIRHHRWSESGQLAATIDNEHCAFYTYDGNGNRAYKLTGNTMLDQYNAGQQMFHAYFNDAVMYVNPYFTISRKNYTRHIFNGTQRIATEIGTSDLSDCIDTTAAGMERLANARAYMQSLFADPIELHSDTGTTFVDIDGEAYDELQWQCFGGDRLWQITIACDSDILLPILRRDSGAADTRVSGKYFYHTDHLGSANWVTKDDEAVQFIHYMPYGEIWYNQRGSAYNERYKYTGKERDEETGNDYFGARYYAAYTPMWLSPDPLMDKYPSISPYAYCNWNPLKFVDPDGKKITIAPNGLFERIAQRFGFSVGYVKKVQQDLEYLKTVNPTTRGMVEQLENSDNEHIIRFPQKKWNNSKPFCSEDFNNHKGQGSVVDYDPDNWKSKNGDKRNPRAGLGHELRHSLDIDKGTGTLESENGIPLMEVDAINTENQVRQQTGDAKRTTYGGKEIPSNLLD